jgi:TolB-like protein/Flp pilus assembly protein TadD
MTGAVAPPDLTREFRVGVWRVRPLYGSLERPGEAVRIEPRIMELLVRLARTPGELVTRQQLFREVWPDVVVSGEVLTRCISTLRAALGDVEGERRYIATVPKRGYVLTAQVAWLDAAPRSSPPAEPAEESIAVLPFVDGSPARDFEWFADGLTDDLTDTLARVNGLRVAARTSAFTFKGKPSDVREIGERLGVRHVLEGSVRRIDGRLRVTARLASARDGFQLWSDTLDREARDLGAVQLEIAGAVAQRLAVHLGERDLARAGRGTASDEAYEWYLRGRQKYQAERPAFRYEGVEELERALAIDPRFAAAHGLHGYIHALRAAHEEPYPQLAPRVRAAYRRALALNPLQPEALMAKAIDVRWRTWDWAEVRALFDQALHVAPGDAHVITHFALRFFRDTGQLDTAARMLRRAIEVDPINPAPRASLSFVLRFLGDYGAAIDAARLALRMNPHHGWAQQALVFALTCAGRYEEAHAALAVTERDAGAEHRIVLEARARLEAHSGDVAKAHATLDRIRALAAGDRGERYFDAAAWACFELGDVAEGAQWLARDVSAGMSSCVFARVCALPIEARRPGLCAAPEFQAVLRRMRLDDESIAELEAQGLLGPPPSSALPHGSERVG